MAARKWEDMESDCLVRIFQRLPLDDLTVGLPLVCKSWLTASLQPPCWKVLDFGSLDLMPWSNFAKRFSIYYSQPYFTSSSFMKYTIGLSHGCVTELRFHSTFVPSLDDQIFAANECPRLKVLVLPRLFPELAAHLPELVGQWKDLERLVLGSKPSCFCEMVNQINLNCVRFCELQVSGDIEEEDVSAIVTFLPRLESLDLSKSYLAREHLITILDGCKELRYLTVRDCIGFKVDEEVMKRASGIKTFEHQGSKEVERQIYETDLGEMLI